MSNAELIRKISAKNDAAMRRLARGPEGWFAYESFDSDGQCEGKTIHEDEDAFLSKPTGVLDARGNMICREPERIGFRLTK